MRTSGWSRHQHFGLRKEWIQLYLENGRDWEKRGKLGNRQVQSLKVWLKTAGLLDRRGNETFLCDSFRKSGIVELFPWEILWVNVVFEFPTASWYVHRLGAGNWTTTEIRTLLNSDYPHLAQWTVSNAVMELVGLLERTPVGNELRQGEVSSGRPRDVRRTGLAFPSEGAVLLSLCRLFVQEKREHLCFDEQILWPWSVFACEKEYIMQVLFLDGKQWFEVTGNTVFLKSPVEEVIKCGFMPIILR